MDNLITWLRAQLDADEQMAVEERERLDESPILLHEEYQSDHSREWMPERVLREVEAKRRIIVEHESYSGYGQTCQTCHRYDDLTGDPWPCPTLRILALPYAESSGYREEWRP